MVELRTAQINSECSLFKPTDRTWLLSAGPKEKRGVLLISLMFVTSDNGTSVETICMF